MRAEAIEAMARYVADVGEDSLELVGIWVDVVVRAREIRAESTPSAPQGAEGEG